jgi:hypothetical protein
MTSRNPLVEAATAFARPIAACVANMPHAENQSSLPNICHRAEAKYW